MYLIDTNICIYIINENPKFKGLIGQKLDLVKPQDVSISSIVVAELEYGACKSKNLNKNRAALKKFISPCKVIPFDTGDAEVFGIIRAELQRKGGRICPYDMQIAAQAICRNYILVTNNTKEFRRISGLRIENWATAETEMPHFEMLPKVPNASFRKCYRN